jgi:hypothetical protein
MALRMLLSRTTWGWEIEILGKMSRKPVFRSDVLFW